MLILTCRSHFEELHVQAILHIKGVANVVFIAIYAGLGGLCKNAFSFWTDLCTERLDGHGKMLFSQ